MSKSWETRHVVPSETARSILRNLSTWTYSPYLFPSPLNAGQPMQRHNFVAKVYEPTLNQAGIQGATWHTLRHTFASRAVMAVVDIRTVQELMGHSTITMTMHYTHLFPAHQQAAVNTANLGAMATKSRNGTWSKIGSGESQATITERKEFSELPDTLA